MLSPECLLRVFHSLATALPTPVCLATRNEAALRHAQLESYDYLNLRATVSIDRLTALVALARRAERQGDVDSHALAALCVFDLLPDVVRSHGPLYAVAPDLFTLCRDVLWSKVDLGGVVIDLSEGAFNRHTKRAPLTQGEVYIGAADIYQVHTRLIRRARLCGRPAGQLEKHHDSNPFSPSDPRHWYQNTVIARFLRNFGPTDSFPDDAVLLDYSSLCIDPMMMDWQPAPAPRASDCVYRRS